MQPAGSRRDSCRRSSGVICGDYKPSPLQVGVAQVPGMRIQAAGDGELSIAGTARVTAAGRSWEGLAAAVDAKRLRVSATFADGAWAVTAEGAEACQGVHARRAERLAEVSAARAAGTYWRERDARMTSTRPIHVDVDPAARAALRAAAIRSGTTIGETVGGLVRAKVKNLDQTFDHSGQGSAGDGLEQSTLSKRGRRAKVFARIASDSDDWTEFKH